MKFDKGRMSVSNAGNVREGEVAGKGRRFRLKTTRKKHIPQDVHADPLGNREQRRAAKRLGIQKAEPGPTVDLLKPLTEE